MQLISVPPPDTGEQVTIIKEDNSAAAIVLGVLFAIVLVVFGVSVAFFIYHSNGKVSIPDVSVKYKTGETQNATLPKDMNIDNPNYMSANLTVNDYNATDENI